MRNKGSKTIGTVVLIYMLCYVFRVFEYFVLRSDQTFWGEAFIHKLIGIMIIFMIVKRYGMMPKDIGLKQSGILGNLGKGLILGITVFMIAYFIEIIILMMQNQFSGVQVYVSAYAIDGNIGNQSAFYFFMICIIGNIINVVMEEGLFRGLFQNILENQYSFIVSALISSVLFGVWHITAPIRSYCDGMIQADELIANMIMLSVTSSFIGFKFCLLTKMSGSLYMSMGDHFVNNTVVNMLHILSLNGVDELQVIRIAVAQGLSCIFVIICYLRNHKQKSAYEG